MDTKHKRPGNTPVEQQERSAGDVAATRRDRLAVSGPGAADFIAASSGLDTPESGGKGMAQTRGEGPLSDPHRVVARPGPDVEELPSERHAEERASGSQTGTIGGGGFDAHNASPIRATGSDDEVDK